MWQFIFLRLTPQWLYRAGYKYKHLDDNLHFIQIPDGFKRLVFRAAEWLYLELAAKSYSEESRQLRDKNEQTKPPF